MEGTGSHGRGHGHGHGHGLDHGNRLPWSSGIGFAASAWMRAAVGCVVCGLAWGMVWLIELPDHPPAVATPVAAPVAAATRLHLAIESSYPVRAWTVQVLGRDQAAAHSDGWSWTGDIDAPAGEDVLVRAVAGDGAPPHRCLRIRLGAQPERLVWGGGDVTATEQLP